MRPTPSICLVTISMGLLFVICNSGKPEEPQNSPASIKELQQKRLATLEKLCDAAEKLYQNARVEYSDVHAAQRELFAARLAYTDTRQDRIRACDEAIKQARQAQSLNQARKDGARGTDLSVLQAQAFEQEAQIARARVEVDK
jgi:outer membrane protein TolC